MTEITKSLTLLLVLLNPFLIIIYLVEVVRSLDRRQFHLVLIRAGLIASAVFCCFGILGDAVFSTLINSELASFQIFGGIVFLLIGIQFVFKGPESIEMLRGESTNVAGAIAMPVLIGPGTISASVVVGERHSAVVACAVICSAVAVALGVIFLLKLLHDFVKPRSEALIERYIEISGRIAALVAGTIAVEMLMQGFLTWSQRF